jgi:hypothetical protein
MSKLYYTSRQKFFPVLFNQFWYPLVILLQMSNQENSHHWQPIGATFSLTGVKNDLQILPLKVGKSQLLSMKQFPKPLSLKDDLKTKAVGAEEKVICKPRGFLVIAPLA